MKMKKVLKVLGAILLVLAIIFGLWFLKFKMTSLTYSNMSDEKTLDYVSKELLDSGVPKENVDIFKKQVEDTNKVLGDFHSFKDGFTDIKGTIVNYDEVLSFDLFGKALIPFDVNCRVSAWNLMKDIIEVKPYTGDLEQFHFEEGIITTYENTGFTQDDAGNFFGLFEPVPSKLLRTPGGHIKEVQKEWNKRGVKFEDSNRKLISCFAYDPIDKDLKAQHVGMMIERENDILFVEKPMPNLPFQASIFKNKDELENHLKQRFIVRFLPIILMENDKPF
ncbi:MAG: DUF4300 family protein [Clostridium sp.]|uniref:DUF4300 family protein n=1 Tax=Clostridium sp. TaxID=1506 RepID=UPI0030357442